MTLSYIGIIMRTIIEIPAEQLKHLSHICNSQKISRAEAIRQAITLYLKETTQGDKAFGIFKNHAIDGVRYQQTLREEWE